jgi:general secretion pathway protein A
MYASSFGLKEPPFSITPDPRYLYLGESHREALAHLLYGIGEGGGFVQLTGEVGTGKTTLCRSLMEQLPSHADVALVFNPALTPVELVAAVCDELGVAYPAGTASLKVLVDGLHRHLLDAHGRGRRTILVVDEAQDLSFEVLEQIRLLTNLETETTKLLQVVLIGQPELIRLLEQPKLRQLAQRITARYHLRPLSAAETGEYVRHRMGVAGRAETGARDRLFGDAALREVYRLSGGVPRLINVICDRALLGAYAGDRERVDGAIVRRAAREVLARPGAPARRTAPVWAAAAALIGGAVTLGWAIQPSVAPWLAGARAVPRAESRPPARSPVPIRPPAPPPAPSLAAVLREQSHPGERGPAFASVLARWQPDRPAPAAGGLECRQGRLETFACLARTGTWTRLRRYNLPAVIELVAPDGGRHYAALTALGAAGATLDIGGRAFTFPLAAVEPFWDGGFTVLWKPPAVTRPVIVPGARGPDVDWLRRRVATIDGAPADPAARDVYDEALKARVVAFQRSHGLLPDGVVGEETLAQLALAVPEPGTPALVPRPD